MFLNRIMVLPVELQNGIFELFYERYLTTVESAKRQGAFDFGVEEIRARNLRRIAEPETLFVDPASGAVTLLHELEGEVDVWRHTFASVDSNAKLGFVRNKQSGRIYGVSPHHIVEESVVYLSAVKGPRRLAGGQMTDREMAYTQLTRGVQKTFLFCDQLHAGDDLKDLAKAMNKSRAKLMAHDLVRPNKAKSIDRPTIEITREF